MKKFPGFLLVLCGLLLLQASAAKLQTSPVRLDLSATQKYATLTVTNQGASTTMIQVDPVAWHQENGEDRYAPTQDLLVVPALFELEAGASQLIRIGMREAPERDRERPYRIYVAEIPDASETRSRSVRVMLRIGIPVFIHSPAAEAAKLQWQASCTARTMRLEAANSGNAHVKILILKLRESGSGREVATLKTADYLLPGTTRSWEAEVAKCPARGASIELFAETDEGPLHVPVSLEE
jgi:fimbrial chaperone protein